MNKSFFRLNELLKDSYERILAIDWSYYLGKNIVYDDVGVPKATGLVAHFVSEPTLGIYTQSYGFLPRPERSVQTVVRKVRLLQENMSCFASLEVRNPTTNDWGGAIRSLANSDCVEYYAVSGLPEIGDHLLVAHMMRECGLLSVSDWEVVTGCYSDHMTKARNDAGISPESYMELEEDIHHALSLDW